MWLFLAFLTALFTSLSDIFSRRIIHQIDVLVIAWGWAFFSLPFLYAYLLFQPLPELDATFWTALAVTTGILTVANILYFKAIHAADLSLSVPMLAFTPLFMMITSPLILGEFPRPMGLTGIMLIVIGSYILNFKNRRHGYWAPLKSLLKSPGPRYMLMVALLYSIGGNIDKIGIYHSSPFAWPAAVNSALALTIGLIVLRRVAHPWREIRHGWKYLLLMGLTISLAFICQMMALTLTLVPYVIAVKRTSIIMTSISGFVFFKEGGIRERLPGVILMVLGVALIYIFS